MKYWIQYLVWLVISIVPVLGGDYALAHPVSEAWIIPVEEHINAYEDNLGITWNSTTDNRFEKEMWVHYFQPTELNWINHHCYYADRPARARGKWILLRLYRLSADQRDDVQPAAAPIPTAMVLFGSGVAGILVMKKGRRTPKGFVGARHDATWD